MTKKLRPPSLASCEQSLGNTLDVLKSRRMRWRHPPRDQLHSADSKCASLRVTYKQIVSQGDCACVVVLHAASGAVGVVRQTIICFNSARADFAADASLNDMVCTQTVMSHTPTRHERVTWILNVELFVCIRRSSESGRSCVSLNPTANAADGSWRSRVSPPKR